MLKHPASHITFRWITAHKDCTGSEEGNQQAEWASSGEHASPNNKPPVMRRCQLNWNKSVMEMGVLRKLQEKASELQIIDLLKLSTKFRKMQVNMTKGWASYTSSYIPVSHVPLNRQLHRMKLIDSPVCTVCNRAHKITQDPQDALEKHTGQWCCQSQSQSQRRGIGRRNKFRAGWGPKS